MVLIRKSELFLILFIVITFSVSIHPAYPYLSLFGNPEGFGLPREILPEDTGFMAHGGVDPDAVAITHPWLFDSQYPDFISGPQNSKILSEIKDNILLKFSKEQLKLGIKGNSWEELKTSLAGLSKSADNIGKFLLEIMNKLEYIDKNNIPIIEHNPVDKVKLYSFGEDFSREVGRLWLWYKDSQKSQIERIQLNLVNYNSHQRELLDIYFKPGFNNPESLLNAAKIPSGHNFNESVLVIKQIWDQSGSVISKNLNDGFLYDVGSIEPYLKFSPNV